MHGHLDQDIPLPVASWACPGGKCWFLRAGDAPEDHRQNDLVILNRELAAAILARGLPAPAPRLWEPRHPGVTGSGLKAAWAPGVSRRRRATETVHPEPRWLRPPSRTVDRWRLPSVAAPGPEPEPDSAEAVARGAPDVFRRAAQ